MNILTLAAANRRQQDLVPPGSVIIAGNATLGWYGEIPASSFITGNALATSIGFVSGTNRFSNEPWLKFSRNGKVLYIAKKNYKIDISWNMIDTRGAVFGTRTIVIDGKTYKVRTLTGNNGTEFDTLLGRVHTAGTMQDKYVNYTAEELDMGSIYTLCQETITHPDWRIGRHNIPSSLTTIPKSDVRSYCGWRPVLELV
jgi:hypothetical protein